MVSCTPVSQELSGNIVSCSRTHQQQQQLTDCSRSRKQNHPSEERKYWQKCALNAASFVAKS